MVIEENKLTEINNYLSKIAIEVDAINDENFDQQLLTVNGYIKKLEQKKADLRNKSSKNDYYYICDMLHNRVKLISQKFDSIIEKNKMEQERISSELSKVVVKKKLINYQR